MAQQIAFTHLYISKKRVEKDGEKMVCAWYREVLQVMNLRLQKQKQAEVPGLCSWHPQKHSLAPALAVGLIQRSHFEICFENRPCAIKSLWRQARDGLES